MRLNKRLLFLQMGLFFSALIIQHYSPSHPDAQEDLFVKLTEYCGSTMMNVSESDEAIPVWDFYHSFFFSYTVVSTIGKCRFYYTKSKYK